MTVKATFDYRHADALLSGIAGNISGRRMMQGAVTEATKDLRESVSVRTGRLRRSIKGKVTSSNSGYVQARFYVYPHLSKKLRRKNAAARIVFKGALRGARKGLL